MKEALQFVKGKDTNAAPLYNSQNQSDGFVKSQISPPLAGGDKEE